MTATTPQPSPFAALFPVPPRVECGKCLGTGRCWYEPFNPSLNAGWGECETCDGRGDLPGIEIEDEL